MRVWMVFTEHILMYKIFIVKGENQELRKIGHKKKKKNKKIIVC